MRTIMGLLAVVGLAGAGGYYYMHYVQAEAPANFRTATIKRGDLLSTISATGTLEPEEVIDVGAQVAGKIDTLGRDPNNPDKMIDFTSIVHEGTLLAQIDDSMYTSQRDQADASLNRSKADLLQCQAKLEQAEQEWKRAESLRPSKAISDTDYLLAVANFRIAKANVTLSEAAIKQAEAALRFAETNLKYTKITSPVEGEIIARRVNVGQTVVASLNAPSLFLIGKDLRRMQVWASVNEADVGRIHPGMSVRFTIETFPGEVFHGSVYQIRLNANMTQNVVTYTVVISTDNSDRKLLPYLTTNVQFEVDHRQDVLTVPNAALRWKPKPQQLAPEFREMASTLLASKPASGRGEGSPGDKGGKRERPSKGNGGDEKAGGPGPAQGKGPDDHGRIWIQDGSFVRPVEVQLGVGDGSATEVSGEGLEEGMLVVIGENRVEQNTDTTNPFTPKLFRKKE